MNKYKLSNLLPLLLAASAVGAVFYATNADATKPLPPEPEPMTQRQDQLQDQRQEQSQVSESYSDSVATSEAASEANNEGNSLSVESSYESGPAEVVLVPHNNTANCQRVYGFGGGDRSGNIVLGLPFRDKTCDLEAAADDAFAQGNITLGWVFKCKQKNLRKAFGGEQECLAAVARPDIVTQLEKRVDVLTTQKETLLQERQYDQERCKESKNRILEGCVKK